jgi:hypothetical protein
MGVSGGEPTFGGRPPAADAAQFREVGAFLLAGHRDSLEPALCSLPAKHRASPTCVVDPAAQEGYSDTALDPAPGARGQRGPAARRGPPDEDLVRALPEGVSLLGWQPGRDADEAVERGAHAQPARGASRSASARRAGAG